MKKLITMLVIGLVMGMVGVGNAARLTLEFDLKVYIDGGNYNAIFGSGSMTFDNIMGEVNGHDAMTSTYLNPGNIQWNTTLPVIESPFNDNEVIEDTMEGYTYDSHSYFSENIEYRTSITNTEQNLAYYYHRSLDYHESSAPRSGVGVSDYAFTPETHISFWERAIGTDWAVRFAESYCIVNLDTNERIAGDRWYGQAIITGVRPAPVPIPATVLLLGTGLAGLMTTKHKRNQP